MQLSHLVGGGLLILARERPDPEQGGRRHEDHTEPLEYHHRITRHGVQPLSVGHRSSAMDVTRDHDPVVLAKLLGRLKDLLDLRGLVGDVAFRPGHRNKKSFPVTQSNQHVTGRLSWCELGLKFDRQEYVPDGLFERSPCLPQQAPERLDLLRLAA